jgi:hypothetical protein
MEVGTAVTPAVQVDAADALDAGQRPLDPGDPDTHLCRQLIR